MLDSQLFKLRLKHGSVLLLLGTRRIVISRPVIEILFELSYPFEMLRNSLTKLALKLTLFANSVIESHYCVLLFENLTLLIIELALKVLTFSLLALVPLLVET